ncbi:MAG: DUF2935 domain-containing protein [Lachnospiraceae bacterium]|nr:DUF2935 domain-containing protein [Lachnospiraceae bacterium]
MNNYIVLSLETHLFFARIMKEHSLFLEAGFPCAEKQWIEQADWFRVQFEALLRDTVELSDGRVGREILQSEEVVTEFTIPAENRTEKLSGVEIDSSISTRQHNLHPRGNRQDTRNDNREITMAVNSLNQRALELLEGLICFKENILECVQKGTLFTANYPLLIEHIIREAKLYRDTVRQLQRNEDITYGNLRKTEDFWNQIMMEHALFIRGLLDPTECELISTADQFAMEYQELLQKACHQNNRVNQMTESTLEKTMRYRDFKAAGTEGILNCKVDSIILPLLADHVLREANHYIRLLEAEE